MQKSALKYYSKIAGNDFIVRSDTMPLHTAPLWFGGLVIYDKDEDFPREKNIKFHIKSDDYFGTLATVIDLITQEKEKIEKRQNKVLKEIKNDLVYLHRRYKIVKKK